MALAACGGGGGGGTGTAAASTTPTTTTAATTTTTVVTPAPVPVGPPTSTLEFTRNYGVGAIHADAAWNQGMSGSGVTVAVIDSGIDTASTELAGRISSASKDIDSTRNTLVGTDRHGTYVASVIAANYNGQGTVGVAFNSTILAIRSDSMSPTCGSDSCFLSSDLAKSLDYATSSGARIVNLSLGTSSTGGSVFEAALQRAVGAGLIVAASAGNEGADTPHYPSGYAVDSRFIGSVIAVGSLNSAGTKSSFSNTAGAAANYFLFAPGESVTTDCNGTTCRVVSGTSFAAPQVAGAMALLIQAYPNMTGKQVVDLLLRTATDLGAPGTDAVYGRGALNLARAFAPAGSLSVTVPGDGIVTESLTPGTTMGAAFGDSVERSGALRTVGRDYYNRPFATNLGLVYAGPRPAILSPLSSDPARRTQMNLDMGHGRQFNMTAGLVENGDAAIAKAFPWMPTEASRDVAVSFRSGRMGFSAWSGKASGNPYLASAHDPYTALAQSDRAVRADYAVGRWLMLAEAGGGERQSPDLLHREDGARYLRTSARTQMGKVQSTFTFGYLDEPQGPLGAYLPVHSGLNLPSKTSFGSIGGVFALSDRFTINTEASLGRTELSGRFLSLEQAAWSTAWRVSLDSACSTFGLRCDGLRFGVAQPLRIESGRFLAVLPAVSSDLYSDAGLSDRRFSAAPSGRQMDFSISATQRTALQGVMQLDAVASTDAGHRRDSAPAFGLLASWRRGF